MLAQGDDMFMIPGTRSEKRLKANLGACQVRFADDELADIRARLPKETAGERY